MTFKEAKEVFLHPDKWAETIVVISAYLEKNPNEDCISRQAVKDLISKYIDAVETISMSTNSRGLNAHTDEVLKQLLGNICSVNVLPPVSPQIKKGHWIDITNKKGSVIALRCSCCKESPKHAIRSVFCPNCGAEMLEEMGC